MNKIIKKTKLLMLAMATCSLGMAQDNAQKDSTGLPGDNFDLQGALELFKNSQSPEDFEKKLNADDNKVNNLDLNNDGNIDYIRVVDKNDKDVHAIVLQVAINENETQDVAAIEIEKDGNESARLQITGADELYGANKIAEPVDEKEKTINGKGAGIAYASVFVSVNVWAWPCVRYIYAPAYVVWVSPWYWMHYPVWWRPWRPHAWRVFYGWERPWRFHYRVIAAPVVVVAHNFYYAHRTSSVTVQRSVNVNRNREAINGNRTERVNNRNRNERANNKAERNNNRANHQQNLQQNDNRRYNKAERRRNRSGRVNKRMQRQEKGKESKRSGDRE